MIYFKHPPINMVKFPNFDSAMSLTRKLDGLSSGPNLDRLMRNANDGWGFADTNGAIEGKNGFWMDGGKPKIGDLDLPDFLKMSKKAQLDYLNSDVFSPSVMSRVSGKMEANFSPNYKKSLARGAESVKLATVDFMDASGKAVKPRMAGAFDSLTNNFSTKMKFGAAVGAGAWGLVSLLQLAEARSGCFLVGPDGQEEKVGGDCTCVGEGNPNADKCCQACVAGGDEMLCPDTDWTGENPPPSYACPGDAVPGRARRMRATISGAAARARDRAQSLASTKVAAASQDKVSCGCVKAGEWYLEHREVSVFGVMGSMLASAGLMLKKGADGLWDIVKDGLGQLAGPLKMILIVVGAVVGLAVLAGITVVVVKAKKRKSINIGPPP